MNTKAENGDKKEGTAPSRTGIATVQSERHLLSGSSHTPAHLSSDTTSVCTVLKHLRVLLRFHIIFTAELSAKVSVTLF